MNYEIIWLCNKLRNYKEMAEFIKNHCFEHEPNFEFICDELNESHIVNMEFEICYLDQGHDNKIHFCDLHIKAEYKMNDTIYPTHFLINFVDEINIVDDIKKFKILKNNQRYNKVICTKDNENNDVFFGLLIDQNISFIVSPDFSQLP